jgi:hypothetical protein
MFWIFNFSLDVDIFNVFGSSFGYFSKNWANFFQSSGHPAQLSAKR